MVDECLVARVRFKATGANIHDVSNWLAVYMANNQLYNTLKTDDLLNQIKNAETVLRQFEYTGQIIKPG